MTEHDDAPDGARRARTARARRLRTHALGLVHPDGRLVRAVETAKLAVLAPGGDEGQAPAPTAGTENAGPADRDPQVAAGPALRAYAALTLGEDGTARTLIDGIVTACDGPAAGDIACLTAAWLAGRWYGWTGQAAPALPWLERLAACLAAHAREAPGPAAPADARRLVARELIALAEAGPDSDLRTAIRRLAGGAEPSRSADAILTLVPAPQLAADPRTVLADLLAGRTDAGTAGWTALALSDRPGAWLLPLLVAGVLGCEPDAERGRVRLRLHAPAAWPAPWGVDRLRVGDGAIELRVTRGAAQVEISADQVSGPLPFTLLLEPTVHAPVTAAEVDGQPAELALRALPDRVIAPVQLVLDAPRRLTLRLGRGA